MNECIFCNIVQKKADAFIVYEDEKTIAFLDIFPSSNGHTLVIPKKHYENIESMTEEELAALAKTIKKVSHAIKEALNPEGLNVILNNGKAAGQFIMHAHFHIVPRSENDGLKLSFNSNKGDKKKLVKTMVEIRQKLC